MKKNAMANKAARHSLILELIEESGRVMTVGEVVDAVRERGINVPGYDTLSRDLATLFECGCLFRRSASKPGGKGGYFMLYSAVPFEQLSEEQQQVVKWSAKLGRSAGGEDDAAFFARLDEAMAWRK